MNKTVTNILIAICFACQSQLFGQADPFGGTPATPSAPSRPVAPAGPTTETDPVVLAVRESNPTTPVELLTAMSAMIHHERPDEARNYLSKLVAAAPDEATMVATHRAFGSGFFMWMMEVQSLAPEGPRLARSIMDAAFKTAHDPARLQALVQQLNDASLGIRTTAMRGLLEGGIDSIAPMVQALADSARAREHQRIRAALVRMGNIAIEPMIGVLESQDDALSAQAVNVLASLEARRAVVYLLRPYASPKSSDELRQISAAALERIVGGIPTVDDARRYLHRKAKEHFDGRLPLPPQYPDFITLWHWDESKKTSVPRQYSSKAASLVVASRLADDLLQFAPGNSEVFLLYLTATFESAKLIGGLDQPLPDSLIRSFADQVEVGVLEEVLKRAMKNEHVPAAIGAVEILAQSGDASLLASEDGRQRLIVQAVRHPDRRLQFAAVNAILRFDPQRAFPGSSHFVEALGHFIGTTGEQRVLIGDPRTDLTTILAGTLAGMGIAADIATSGRKFMLKAAAHPDYDFVFLSDGLGQPHYKEVVQMMRRDPRTANLPIGLVARSENSQSLKRFAEKDPLTFVMPWPHENSTLGFQITRLLKIAGDRLMLAEEKVAHANVALDAMIRFVEQPEKYPFVSILPYEESIIAATDVPQLSRQAMTLLGLLGTTKAQQTLVTVASENARPITERQSAAAAFDVAVKRRGTMLVSNEIKEQYIRYNRSGVFDIETQNVLAAILDTIEGKEQKQPQNPYSTCP